MKTIKKAFAMLLAVVMVLGLSVTAFAANDGSITIKNAAVGETYKVYKVFDLTYVDSGTYKEATYDAKSGETYYTKGSDDSYTVATDPANATEQLYVKVYNVAYTYTKSGDSDSLYTALAGNDSPFTLTASAGNSNVYVVTLKEGKAATDVVSFLKTNLSLLGEPTATQKATATGDEKTVNLTFSGLALGYYYVTSTMGTVVTIDSTMPDVTVVDKNEAPSEDKQVKEDSNGSFGDSNTAEIGDTVEFRTKVTIPNGTVKLVLHDDLSDGLTLVADSIKVYTDENLQTALADGNYTVKTSGFAEGDTCDFEVAFTDTYLSGLTDETTTLYVSYKATVNASAVVGESGNLNETYLSYGDAQKTEKDETKTYVFDFDLHKYANNDTTGYLADAEFILSYGSGDDTKYAQFSKSTDGLTYTLTAWTSDKDQATHIVTTSTGKITIKGLDADTYQLIEVKAPNGYNLLTSPVTVVIAEGGSVTVGTNTTAVNEVQVQNQSGTELPSTGGIGTTIFYVVGSILVIGAAVLLIVKKRISGTQE